MRIIYVHGFNSYIGSTTGTKLRTLNLMDIFEIGYPSDGMFEDNLNSLRAQYAQLPPDDTILLGTSLGGFYISQLADLPGIKAIVMINPVVYPEKDLAQFLGKNKNFCTHEKYEFTEEALHSYHEFRDMRQISMVRYLLLAMGDTLLNPLNARAYYDGYAELHLMDGGHRLEDFELVRQVVREITTKGVEK